MDTTTNFYERLGVSRDATQDEIKQGYRKMAGLYHPDKNQDDPLANEAFKLVSEAYTVLSNPARKRQYDQGNNLPSSIMDLRQHVQTALAAKRNMPSAKAAPVPGQDILVIGIQALTVNVTLPTNLGVRRFCQIPHNGQPGKNGGEAGHLWLYVTEKDR